MRRSVAVIVLAALPALVRCDRQAAPAQGPPRKDCSAHIWAKATTPGGAVRVAGQWTSWAPQVMAARDDGFQLYSVRLPPGEYAYVLDEGGVSRLDPYAAFTSFVGDAEVSALVVGDCAVPAVLIDAATSAEGGAVTVRASFVATGDGTPLEPASIAATLDDGQALSVTSADAQTGTFVLGASGLSRGKHGVSVVARDGRGVIAPTARAAAWVDPAAPTWDDGLLYQIVVDRFRASDGAALAAPKTPGARAGGTLDGVRVELERGTFEALGVTALWLSPVYVSPVEARLGRDGHPSEGYHGYWPASARTVEPRFGGEAALHGLIDAAHRRGIRVLLDLVPNHVYETHPRYLAHAKDGWFHDGPGACVCGDPGCDWSTHLLSCWFTPYLPDVRHENADAMAITVDDAVWWTSTFDADGVRIDAVPLMPRSATRRVAAALRTRVGPPRASLVLGEVYTGPGEGAVEEIRYFLGPSGLDAAFDFPLMWALRDAIATGVAGFDVVEGVLAREEQAYAGSGTLIPRILGNHDTTRFLSAAAGDDGADPWTLPPSQDVSEEAYARMRLGLVALLTQPGMPVLYYGDEVALAGAGDPDARRVLPSEEALSPAQRGVRELARRLGSLRRCSASLRAAARTPLLATRDAWAYARGDVVVVLSARTAKSSLAITGVASGVYRDALSGASLTLPGDVPLGPLTGRVLVPADGPCP